MGQVLGDGVVVKTAHGLRNIFHKRVIMKGSRISNDVPCKITTKDGKQVIDLVYGVKVLKPMSCARITTEIVKPKRSKFKLGITFKIFEYRVNI